MPTPTYDVCVIGSGAAGGVVTKELCEGGAKVLLLEAGAEVPPHRFRSHCWPYDMQFRGFRSEKQAMFYPGDVQSSIRYTDSDADRSGPHSRAGRPHAALERRGAALRPPGSPSSVPFTESKTIGR